MDLRDRLGVQHLVVQAGMGGSISTPELAAAVSRAGALGSIGQRPAPELADALRSARHAAEGKPIAANLLVPFVDMAQVDVCIAAKVAAVVLFYGFRKDVVARLRDAGIVVLHQVGTPAEARRALADGADALVAQGLEAGGHLLGVEPTLAAVARIREVAGDHPVLAAGGIVDAAGVRAALAAGAAGVMAGSRFLLTEESGAHRGYKRRVLGAPRTIVTRLFGVGWPARHRVVPNRATERWCDEDGREPRWVAALQRATAPLAARLPQRASIVHAQRLAVPLYSPLPACAGMDDAVLDVSPLYAGEAVRGIGAVLPAAAAVALLTGSST